MAWPCITGNRIAITQQKAGRQLVIPLHHDLIVAFGEAEREHLMILTTMYGKPMVSHGGYAMQLPMLDCRSNASRMACERLLANALRKQAQPQTRLYRSSVTRPCQDLSATLETQAKHGSRTPR